MSLTLTLVIGIVIMIIVIVFHLIEKQKPPKGFPPGPPSLPLIGNWHQIGFSLHENLTNLGKKYGGIFSIDFGSYRSVVLNDLRSIKQCLNDPAFSGRPKYKVFELVPESASAARSRGIVFSELQHWTEQRRFALKNLRDFGFGKNSMEGIIQEEIQELIENLRTRVGQSIDTKRIFNAAVLNSVWEICTGSRKPHDDPDLQNILAVIAEAFAQPFLLAFPILAKLFPNWSGYNKDQNANNLLTQYVKADFEGHKITLTPGKPRNLMDAMIEQIANTSDPASSFYKAEGEQNVIRSLVDLFLGGAETTSTTLRWLFLFMALHPEIQEKMSEEIQKVIGPSRQPELIDRSKMPFTECVIMEVTRYAAIFPLGVKHSTLEEVNIGGYIIPKDTVVTPNLYAVLHDEGIWGDPEVFRPERFLLPDGTPNKNHEAFIPFSVGKRMCIGDKLAKNELFIFTTRLFQEFRVTTNPAKRKPSLKPRSAVILTPKPHELILYERH